MTHDNPTGRRRSVLPSLLLYTLREAPVLTIATALCALVAGGAPVGVTIGIGQLVGALTDGIGQGLSGEAAVRCFQWIVVVVVLFFVGHVFESLRTACGRMLGRKVTGRLEERIMATAAGPATIRHLEEPDYLARLSRAGGAGPIPMSAGEAVFGMSTRASLWVTTIGSAALLAWINWALGAFVLVAFALIHSRLVKNFRTAVVENVSQTTTLRRTSYLRTVPTAADAAREVRIFGLSGFFRDAYHAEWRRNMAEVWARRRKHDAFVVVVVVVTGLTVAGVFVLLGSQVATGRSPMSDLATGGLAIRALLQVLRADDDDLRIGFGSTAAAEALSFEPPGPAPVAVTARPEVPTDVGGHSGSHAAIACEGLAFRYGGRQDDVLREIDLSVPSGQSLAIVGLNGAGKTTLARVLAGLDEPSAGTLRTAGRAIDDDDARRAWQRDVVAVFQDFGRYELTVRENIAFGSLAHADDEDGIRAVARQAGLLDFIEALPQGWDTVMSSGYVGGVDASGGEWQRIAIARALFGLRHGARLLMMDEPAANLDARAEADLYDTFHELTAGATTVAISHRFATVRKAERVVVMEGGRIIEDGSHDDLIRAGGRYEELFQLQAKRFQEENA